MDGTTKGLAGAGPFEFEEETAMQAEQIKAELAQFTPQLLPGADNQRRAAVAMLLHENVSTVELLFIRRAHYAGDPWSGDVAFPGGGIEPQDAGPRQAAEREVLEEIGLSLRQADFLGQLDDLTGAYLPVLISPFVYLLADKPRLKFNGEVVDAFWVPLEFLDHPQRNQEKTFRYRGKNLTQPIICLDGYCDHFLWGISYRILQGFFDLLRPAPR